MKASIGLVVIILTAAFICEAKVDMLSIVQSIEEDTIEDVVVGKGDMTHGYYTYETFWSIIDKLRAQYPQYISQNITFGNSYTGLPLNGFFLGKQAGTIQSQTGKATILIDSSHHAREATSFEMLLLIFMKELSHLAKNDQSADVYDTASLLIYPVVNVDGVIEINKNYAQYNQRRKNMRKIGCDRQVDDGVDINRNYDVKFDKYNQNTIEKCSDEYHGEKAFSEPETRAVKDMINEYPNIFSALNLHCYGNLWIHPYNFLEKNEKFSMETNQPALYKLYKDFIDTAKFPKGAAIGQAVDIIDYSAQGEASDWMALKKNIFAWSPELGAVGITNDDFYVEPSDQRKTVDAQYPIIKQLIDRHSLTLAITGVDKTYIKGNNSVVLFNVDNLSYAKMISGYVKVSINTKVGFENSVVMKPKIVSATLEVDKSKVADSIDVERRLNIDLDRLSSGYLRLELEDQTALYLSLLANRISITYHGKEVLQPLTEDQEYFIDGQIMLRGSMNNRTIEGRIYIGAIVIVIMFFVLTLGPRVARQTCCSQTIVNKQYFADKDPAEIQMAEEVSDLQQRKDSDGI